MPKPRPEAGEGALDEEKIHGRPDYWSRQKTRSRDARQGTFRELGVTQQTLYHWKKKFSGMDVADARRLKELESENTKLKRLVADLSLDIVMLKDVNSKKW
ncbi:MAG: transposase [Bdellovibrionaceae bacterium]|nr:transposase [Pseudobdellovibrionaceae bacterium]